MHLARCAHCPHVRTLTCPFSNAQVVHQFSKNSNTNFEPSMKLRLTILKEINCSKLITSQQHFRHSCKTPVKNATTEITPPTQQHRQKFRRRRESNPRRPPVIHHLQHVDAMVRHEQQHLEDAAAAAPDRGVDVADDVGVAAQTRLGRGGDAH